MTDAGAHISEGFQYISGDDGFPEILDRKVFDAEVMTLVNAINRVDAEQRHEAASELRRIFVESGSASYAHYLAQETVKAVGLVLLDLSDTFTMAFALKNLQAFMLAWRSIRPEQPNPQV